MEKYEKNTLKTILIINDKIYEYLKQDLFYSKIHVQISYIFENNTIYQLMELFVNGGLAYFKKMETPFEFVKEEVGCDEEYQCNVIVLKNKFPNMSYVLRKYAYNGAIDIQLSEQSYCFKECCYDMVDNTETHPLEMWSISYIIVK